MYKEISMLLNMKFISVEYYSYVELFIYAKPHYLCLLVFGNVCISTKGCMLLSPMVVTAHVPVCVELTGVAGRKLSTVKCYSIKNDICTQNHRKNAIYNMIWPSYKLAACSQKQVISPPTLPCDNRNLLSL